MARKIPEETKMAIVETLKEGELTRREIANKFGVSYNTVARIAHGFQGEIDRSRTKKAAEAKKRWGKKRRLELIAAFLDKIEELLKHDPTSKDIKDLSTSLGILIDKARLEEGEPTEIMQNKGVDVVYIDLEKLPSPVRTAIAREVLLHEAGSRPRTVEESVSE